jgi:hypothetical protein
MTSHLYVNLKKLNSQRIVATAKVRRWRHWEMLIEGQNQTKTKTTGMVKTVEKPSKVGQDKVYGREGRGLGLGQCL